jgi:outer membrane protein OmpA-like peptidoglycan-associated protein
MGLALGACSTMADIGEATSDGISTAASAMNPANWFGDDDETDAEARAKQNRVVATTSPKTGAKSASRDTLAQRSTERDEERYPKLSSVPERPREATSRRAEKTREELREGLVADTANAQYTDSQLRARTSGAAASATADSARSNERISGEPKAVPAPRAPVTSAPVAAAPPAPQKQVAAATPRVAPPPIERSSAPQRAAYGAQQAAAAAAAPVTPVSPSANPSASPGAPSQAAAPAPKPQQQAALARPDTPTAPRTAEPAPRSVLKTVQVATIYFNDGSSRLSANDKRVVDQVAEAARRTGGLLRIVGHSSMSAGTRDTEEAALVNYRVSLARANAVAVELLRHGIPGNQMQVMAEGARNPIYSERAPTGAAGNRRAEIYLDYYEQL